MSAVQVLVILLAFAIGALCFEKMDKRYWRSRARRELADKHQAWDERHQATLALILGRTVKPDPRKPSAGGKRGKRG